MASKTILVIDADSETEQLIASTLESEGYLVFAVPGGDVGTEMAQKVSPSLIFVNAEETGLEICKRIHEFESLQKVPLVLLTSPVSRIDVGSVATFGVVDFLDVPCAPDQLLEKTAKILSAKAPIVLRVREKERATEMKESRVPDFFEGPSAERQKEVQPEPPAMSRPEMSGIEELDQELEGSAGPAREAAPEFAEPSFTRDVKSRRRKRSSLPLVTAGLVIVIAAFAAFLFYPGLMRGPGTKKPVYEKPMGTAAKPKTATPAPAPSPSPAQSPAASDEEQRQQAATEGKAVTPPPSPAATAERPTSKAAGKKTYSVQLGAFRSESNAGALAEQFKSKGYDAFVVKTPTKDKGAIYHVLVGKSEDRRESLKLAARIKDKEKVKAAIYEE